MPDKRKEWFGGNIGEGRIALEEITIAVNSSSMGETVKQIMLQIQRDMRRQNITNFTYSDVRVMTKNDC